MKPKTFEAYPLWIVLTINLINLSVYAAGLYLLCLILPTLSLIYLVYLLYLEFVIYKNSCACCYYYGKLCAFGRGKIAEMFIAKDNPKKFCERQMTFKDFIPHLLTAIAPLVAGIYLLLKSFSWLILAITAWPLIITALGNPIIYGKLACPHCKQGQICCPACDFFMKKQGKK